MFAQPEIDPEIIDNLVWQAGKSDAEIMSAREQVLEALDLADREQRASGLLEAWWQGTDPDIRRVAGVIGLLELLC